LQVFIAAQTVASADVPSHHLCLGSRIQGTRYNFDVRIAGLARQGQRLIGLWRFSKLTDRVMHGRD
jgi:hypothetical protein